MIRGSSVVEKTYGSISTSVTGRPPQTPGLYRAYCETNRVTRMRDFRLRYVVSPLRSTHGRGNHRSGYNSTPVIRWSSAVLSGYKGTSSSPKPELAEGLGLYKA
ncbi:hypothetical protein QAD02_020353 [Eretmocerus hayati]|uniref:Uncharacterized protein n=1 Tax=Eretmocerus hayati TaxID=131215 RepID=A0ACC2PM57_9HYME|nr:hypothetical protein QAD02_020353 [Eretmocerus hayati]